MCLLHIRMSKTGSLAGRERAAVFHAVKVRSGVDHEGVVSYCKIIHFVLSKMENYWREMR